MKSLFILLSFFSAPVFASAQNPVGIQRSALPWYDVAYDGYYYLTQDLKVNEAMQLPEGQKVSFVSVANAGGVPVNFFELALPACADPKATEELFLINPTGRSGEEVGVELRENCHLVFYVENNMMGIPSIFTDSAE